MNLQCLNIVHELTFSGVDLKSSQKAVSCPYNNWATIASVNASCLAT